MIAGNDHRPGAPSWHAAPGGGEDGADGRDEPGATVPEYVRLAYERIDRTDQLLARIEHVLVAARRPRD